MARGWLTDDNTPMLAVLVGGKLFAAVLDTGFTGGLLVPEAWFVPDGRPPVRTATFELPDGLQVRKDVFSVDLEVAGKVFDSEVLFADGNEVLLGAAILSHFALAIDYPAGTVTLDAP